MVDLILNTLREFIEPLPTYTIWQSGVNNCRMSFDAANINIAKRAYAKAYGLKSVRRLVGKEENK